MEICERRGAASYGKFNPLNMVPRIDEFKYGRGWERRRRSIWAIGVEFEFGVGYFLSEVVLDFMRLRSEVVTSTLKGIS